MIAIRDYGDVVAFRTLYDKYASAVLGLSYKIVGNRALAEDIAQETFWRIWQNAAQFDSSKGRFTSWMFGIGRNLSIDALRKNKRVTLQPIFDEQTQSEAGEETHALDDDVADLAWAEVRHREIRSVINELPPDQMNVIIWIYFQGKTRREIAAEQNIPFGTINTRARLALKKLHALLEERGMNE
ncbi:MAG: RNA polymerase sigma factor [Anaerolineae bacterium]